MGSFFGRLIKYAVIQSTIIQEKEECRRKSREIEKKLKQMQKYIHVPADLMTTDQIIEDYRNWEFRVHVLPTGYLVQSREGINLFRAADETELRNMYESAFNSVKII